jgi:hypothetical protein
MPRLDLFVLVFWMAVLAFDAALAYCLWSVA